MARDTDPGSVFVFDLVEEDEADPGSWSVAAPTDGTDRVGASGRDEHEGGEPPSVSRGPGGRRRAAAHVAAVLAIVLGTGIASGAARDDARVERVRDLDGGVADLSVPLEEKWAWGGIVGAGESAYQAGSEVVVLGGRLVFESGRDLVALDPATGEEAWTVPLGDDPNCGPMAVAPYEGTPMSSTPSVVCLRGEDADHEVVAVGPDGVASAPRALEPADTERYGPPRPGPDGTVLRATRVGPGSKVDLGDARCDDTGECSGTVAAGRDVELRAEDAATGEERWSLSIPFQPAQAGDCLSRTWEDPDNFGNFDGELYPDDFGASVAADLVRLEGCGIEAAVTPDGVVLGAEVDPELGFAERRGEDGYVWLDYEGPARTVVYSDDGAVVGEVAVHVRGPMVADGSGPDTVLGADETGQRLRAYDVDGTQRWDAGAAGAERFLAQVGETAVVSAGGVEARGLDVATGAERWRWGTSAADDGVLQTFTDGRSVLLVLTQNEPGAPRMVSLDAVTGEVLWQESGDAATRDDHDQIETTLIAVDGHLVEVSRAEVRELG